MLRNRVLFRKQRVTALWLGFFLFCFSCADSSQIEYEENDESQPRSLRDRGRSGSRCGGSSRDITINDLKDINSRNAGNYLLAGKCETSNEDVEISIGGDAIATPCTGSRWSIYLDVTGVVQGLESVEVSASAGGECASAVVDNFFDCPEGYIPVPRLDRYTDDDFCVMQYEAQRENGSEGSRYGSGRRGSSGESYRAGSRYGSRDSEDQNRGFEKAVSISQGEPWTRVSRRQAIQNCRNNGTGYDLISNDEWQTVARHIESYGENWSLGRAVVQSNNSLNKGVISRRRPLSSDRNGGRSDRYGDSSRRSSTNTGDWDPGRRYHILPNGVEIWDLAGNVWELVRDTAGELGIEEDENENIAELTGVNKKLFGPKKDYSSFENTRGRDESGLGYAYLSNVEDIVMRGGASSRDSGIFSVDAKTQEGRLGTAGFRCVYYP